MVKVSCQDYGFDCDFILDDDLDALQKKRAEIKKKYPKG